MAKMLQIYDDDLGDLERLMPEISGRLIDKLDNALRTKLRRVQTILSNVRWGYGPPTHVEKISLEEEPS